MLYGWLLAVSCNVLPVREKCRTKIDWARICVRVRLEVVSPQLQHESQPSTIYTLVTCVLRERAGAYDGSVGRRRAVEIKLML